MERRDLAEFLIEAESFLETISDHSQDLETRQRAGRALLQAASSLRVPALEICLEVLVKKQERGRENIAEELERAKALIARLRSEDELPGDWDPDTASMLRAFFVEEAEDHLERMGPSLEQLDSPRAAEALVELLRQSHTLKGSASTVGMLRFSDAAHQIENHFAGIQRRADPLVSGEIQHLQEALDLLRRMLEADDEQQVSLLESLGALLSRPARVTDRRQENRREGQDRRTDEHHLRVVVGRLDDLMNVASELVIDRTRIERRVKELKRVAEDLTGCRRHLGGALGELSLPHAGSAENCLREIEEEIAGALACLEHTIDTLVEDTESLQQTTHAVQEHVAQVRMMPIRWLHARLHYPLKEMAESQGKRISLVMDDESSEIDRSVGEQMIETLIQLIRNAVVHGIEAPEERLARGKSEQGQIHISARHQGDLVIIEVEDDGGGIDVQRLREMLKEQGDEQDAVDALSDEQVLETLFVSGFTTRDHVDQLSGRGVGLDLVRSKLRDLGGSIRVATQAGAWTRFTLRIPLTMAIAQALLFKVGEDTYAIPVLHVVRATVVDSSTHLRGDSEQAQVKIQGEWLPLVELDRLFGVRFHARTSLDQPLILLRFGSVHFCVTCTRIVGPRDIVLKRLGPLLAGLPLFAGATISGSSKIQFILDVATLAKIATGKRRAPATLAPKIIAPGASAHERQRLLLADDSRAVREAVIHLLQDAGYLVDAVTDGFEAWQQLQQHPYDLLVTDLEMPRLHGQELITRCRATDELKALPIIVLSSRTGPRSRGSALDKGADVFVPKPVNRQLVLREVARLLGRVPQELRLQR